MVVALTITDGRIKRCHHGVFQQLSADSAFKVGRAAYVDFDWPEDGELQCTIAGRWIRRPSGKVFLIARLLEAWLPIGFDEVLGYHLGADRSGAGVPLPPSGSRLPYDRSSAVSLVTGRAPSPSRPETTADFAGTVIVNGGVRIDWSAIGHLAGARQALAGDEARHEVV